MMVQGSAPVKAEVGEHSVQLCKLGALVVCSQGAADQAVSAALQLGAGLPAGLRAWLCIIKGLSSDWPHDQHEACGVENCA